MAYAFITEIKNVRKHSNADRLQIGECFGNQVIVSLETKENDKGVYIATDSRIGLEFGNANNLLRKKNDLGEDIGGYIDVNKRNLRALKLRGEMSDGLFLSLSSLESFTGNINELKVGDCVDVLGGFTIAEKYIPAQKISNNTPNSSKDKKKKSKINYPFFNEHKDTSQYAYNKHVFKVGDIITISLKMHGCFTSDTRVRLWGVDKTQRMKNIKIGDIVVGMNENGILVPTKVSNIFMNGRERNWIKLKISRRGLAGEKYSSIECTEDHKFWDDNSKEFIQAKDLKEGQEITIVKNSLILTDMQKEILTGLCIGDGYYSESTGSGKVEFSHKLDHEELVVHTMNSLGNMANPKTKIYKSGYGTDILRASTIETADLKKYMNTIRRFKPDENGNKLKNEFINNFTKVSLAYLYMSDGSLAHSDFQQDRANIAICSFNDHDSNIIKTAINNLGFNAVLFTDNRGFNRIRFNLECAKKLFAMIAPYIPIVVQYKIPEIYRTDILNIATNAKNGYIQMNSYIAKKDYVKYTVGKGKYDLETETHNYVVGNSIVHNSSARTANAIKIETIKQSILNRILIKLNMKSKTKKTYECVTGTRRVVLEGFNGGYYESNNFRKKYHDDFKNKLKKGEEVFYEIVGFTDTNKLVMNTCENKKVGKDFVKQYGKQTLFNYGCEEFQSEIYVYRMTFTNEDGEVFEYPTWVTQQRCEEMFVNHVPILDQFIFTTIEDLDARMELLCDGIDPIGKTHIREGVVARRENLSVFSAYKHKNFNFKVLEGIIKDSGEVDMEEEQELNKE